MRRDFSGLNRENKLHGYKPDIGWRIKFGSSPNYLRESGQGVEGSSVCVLKLMDYVESQNARLP